MWRDLERLEAGGRASTFIFFGGADQDPKIAAGKRRCYACGSKAGVPSWEDDPEWFPRYCLGCDTTGHDLQTSWPGLAVDSAPDPDYPAGGPAYAPDPELAGGTGPAGG